VDTQHSSRYCLKASSEAYEDALDSIRFYAAKHPEWRAILAAIQSYVATLEASAGLHEPGT
jgi:hypothetical protein